MGKLPNLLNALLLGRGPNSPTPEPQPPRMIVGGSAARELCMLPTDLVKAGVRYRDAAHRRAHLQEAILAEDTRKRVVQLKADGINAMYLEGQMVSGREGTPLDCALHCQPGLRRLEDAFGVPMVFFGEYTAGEGFSATLDEHKRREGSGVFWLYDAVPHGAWVTGLDYEIGTLNRLNRLREVMMDTATSQFVGMLDHMLLTAEETVTWCAELWAAGFEGVVSKRVGAPFTRSRSLDWLRIKNAMTITAPIIDMAAAKDGTLKMMVVRTASGPMKIGTGWTKEQGRTILAMHAAMLVDRPIDAVVSFELASDIDRKRAVRGARFHGIAGENA